MDYMFEDDLFEIGAEVDAYCTRCKSDTRHTVLTKYEDEIRSVLCTTCNTSHAYRPPRGETEEEIPEPIAVRRRQALHKLSWNSAMEELDTTASLPYSPRECYTDGQVLEHPSFGLGCVTEVLSDTKLEALFEDGSRLLVHNRQDLPATKHKKHAKAAPKKKKAPKPTKSTTKKTAKKKTKATTKAKSEPQKGNQKNKKSKKTKTNAKAGSRTSRTTKKSTSKKPSKKPSTKKKPVKKQSKKAKKKPSKPARKPSKKKTRAKQTGRARKKAS